MIKQQQTVCLMCMLNVKNINEDTVKCDLHNLDFLHFAIKYKPVNGKLIDQPDNLVPRVFPTYSSNPKSTNFGLYCKYQLLRYKPWKNKQDDAWENQPNSNDVFISKWKTFLQTDYAKKHVPDWHGKLEDIQSICDNEQTENYVESEQQREEWMVLADFIQSANSNDFDVLSENDWHSCSYPYTPQQLLQMSAWINSTKQHYETQHPNFNIDISTFSSM